jgi:predicted RNA-binding protein (virulence factor B family)
VNIGSYLKAYIKTIRADNKIDVIIQKQGLESVDIYTERILDYLKKNFGKMLLTDSSPPEDIKEELKMSKKQFKKTIGVLYKAKKVKLESDCVILIS